MVLHTFGVPVGFQGIFWSLGVIGTGLLSILEGLRFEGLGCSAKFRVEGLVYSRV